jgi:hypothetical protein
MNTQELLLSVPQLRTRCEIWTRVMGYHRPVSQFNIGKKSEHYERTHFQEENSCVSPYAC